MKVSKNFSLVEFIPPAISNKYGDNGLWFVRPETVKLAQFIRDWFKMPMVINNYHRGGPYKERGFRLPESVTGAAWSQHKLANAIDFTIDGLMPDEIRHEILTHQKEFLAAGLTTIEHEDYSPTWVHSDIRFTKMDKILIVKPANVVDALSVGVEDSKDKDEYFIWDGELKPFNFRLF